LSADMVPLCWGADLLTYGGDEPLMVDPLEWDLMVGDLMPMLRRIGDAGARGADG
jgi:hypothetical protein